MTENRPQLMVAPTTATQLDFLARLTGEDHSTVLATAVQNAYALALFQAARSPTFTQGDLLNLLTPLGGKLEALAPTPPEKAAHRLDERVTVSPPASTPPAPAKAQEDPLGALVGDSDPDTETVLTYAEMMTADFASRGLVSEIKKYEGKDVDVVKVGKILSAAGWPRRPQTHENVSAVWLAKKQPPANGLRG